MSDDTPRDREPTSTAAWLLRSLPSPHRNVATFESMVTKGQPRDVVIDASSDQSGGVSRDWSASLDLIHEATTAIRISEERSNDLEQELKRTVAQALVREEALESQLATARSRAELAEKRAAEAEEWLTRMHDAVVSGFTRTAPRKTPAGESSSAA